MLPLQGIRVLDLSTVVFGPLASQVLADYGAEVVKIEPPAGDSTRHTGPSREAGMSSLFLGTNRGKKSVVLDLKDPMAREALDVLIDTADVFMHSMRPQKLPGLGIDADRLLRRNPRLIYAGLHGFAWDGPYGGRPAYDDVVQGMSGLVALVERQTGEARYLPIVAADKTCAHVAAHAVLAALLRRERTGSGGFVEIPMFESMVAFNLVEHLYGGHFEPAPAALGYPRVLDPWRRPYRTADSHIAMIPYSDAQWQRFFAEVEEPQLAQDPRFVDIANRTRHIGELLELAASFIARRTTADWLRICERLDIPAAPINKLEAVLADPHLEATGFFESVEDDAMGRVRFPGVPVRFDGQRPQIGMPPRLGQHTRGVLTDAGVSASVIEHVLASATAAEM